ncbi:MAG: hypothetical protein FWG02_04400 [Holophagaceae bacterium]|nr:hypothetical protein [Holophagaceae bacterium]
MTKDTDGKIHLQWIGRIQLCLLPVGIALWAISSYISIIIFLVGGISSLILWHLHKWIVVQMLTPSVKRRWFYAIIGMLKLGLITILLYVIMKYFPREVLPFVTGLLLFVIAILIEAIRLTVRHFRLGEDKIS